MKIKVQYVKFPFTTEYVEVAALAPEEVGAVEDASIDELLGRTWRAMNCVDGDPETEVCVRLRVRSMMVGDRVVLETDKSHVTYQCAPVGWELLEAVSGAR